MAEIIGQPQWSPVRLLEDDEYASGGEDGNMNEQAKSLANRIEFLKENSATKDEVIAMGGGRFGFSTMADFEAKKTTLPVDSIVNIAEEGPYQGDNIWDGSILRKSPYDPLQQAKNFAKEISNKEYEITIPSKNIFDESQVLWNAYLASDGTSGIMTGPSSEGWACSGFIPVEAGKTYIIHGARNRLGAQFFKENKAKSIVENTYTNAAFPLVVIAPPEARFFIFNLQTNTAPDWSQIQMEEGNTATEYHPFGWEDKTIDHKYINGVDLERVITQENIEEQVNPYLKKPYDIVYISKNLFNENKIQQDKLLDNLGRLVSSSGWGTTDYIPVEENQLYTISALVKGRHGLSFFANKEDTLPILYEANPSLPLTIKAPVGAQFLVANLYSATSPNFSQVQIEHSSVATPYEKGGTFYKIDASFIQGMETRKNTLLVDGDIATVSGFVDGEPISINLSLTKDNTHSQSNVFNFTGDYVGGILQRNLNDDVAPMRLDGTTIGANHGYAKVDLTMNNHGKTTLDIGSRWTDGINEWVIVEIISASRLSVTARTSNINKLDGSTLIHISGASNIADITPTNTVAGQWYPSIRDRKLTCSVDDNPIDLTLSANYEFFKTIKFFESYSILKKSDIVEWLIANPGQDHLTYDVPACYSVSFAYTFDHECGCSIYFGGVGRKQVALVDQMITQSIQLSAANGTVYNYIPKSLPFSHAGMNYDFAMIEDIRSKSPPKDNPIYITPARQEAGINPIDRLVMLNDQVGYATGYLPILDASPDVRNFNASRKYLEIRDISLKVYPRLIDSAAINQINTGDSYAAIAYRKYFKRSSERTTQYTVRSNHADFLFLDWHTHKVDEIDLPADLIGREIEIHEKSSNVTLLSKFSSNSIWVNIDDSKPYGYLVLKFKK